MQQVRSSEVGHGARRARTAHLFMSVGLVACAAMVVVGEPVRGWLLVALVTATAGTAVVAVRRRRSAGNPEWLLLVGTVLLVPAYTIWYPLTLRWDLRLGSPAITDWLFLGAYAAFVAALVRLVRERGHADRAVHLLDSLIISIGLGVLVWVGFISPYLQDDAMSWPARLVAVSYTVVDVLLFGAVARLLVEGEIASTGMRVLTAWIGAQLAADLIYSVTSLQGTFQFGNAAAVLYSVSFVMLGTALLDPSTMGAAPPSSRDRTLSPGRRILLVGSAALIAPAVLVVLGLRGETRDVPIVALLAAVLFALVLWRVWLLMVDVQQHRRIQARLTMSIDQERRQARENQELLASLRERQMLAERLFRIQRKISTRAPLQDVLDSITSGAAELLRDDVVGLRLVDEDQPGVMVMVSSVGVPARAADELHRLPLGVGVGGRALVEDRLCLEEDYGASDGAIGAFVEDGLHSAMAAPVHLEGAPIGSLVVASAQRGAAVLRG